MVHLLRACLQVLAIFAFCRVSAQSKPTIEPSTDIILNEGEPLEISCSDFKEIHFSYPIIQEDAAIVLDPEIINYQKGGTYISKLWQHETIRQHTGWYGCANREVEVTVDSYSDPTIAWTYVYVQSDTNFFVHNVTFASLREIVGGTTVIPCRPTSPNLNVTLRKDDEEIEWPERVSFDPRIGFTVVNLTLKDSGYFKCSINKGDEQQEVLYLLHVLRKQVLSEPKIIEDTLRHVTRGQTLRVNCTVDIGADMQYVFNWTTPQHSNRISTNMYSVLFGRNARRATCELVIQNVLDEDEGEYVCTISSFSNSKRTTKYIKVHDPSIRFIHLRTQDNQRHYERQYNRDVQWIVDVDAYPQPHLRWLNPKGEEITDNWNDPNRTKYAVKMTPLSTTLRINRLDVSDMGIYSLQAANEDKIETLNFTLHVLAKPIPILEAVESYYAPGETHDFRCHVAAYPEPNTTWTFLKCPNYPSLENATLVDLHNKTDDGMITSFLSTVSMTISMSGHLNCTTCNSLGCDSVAENIFVSDGNGGFGILEPEGPVIEGDNLKLICAASVYNYTNSIMWLNEDDTSIFETDKIKVVQNKTNFTYRSILQINNVEKDDAKSFSCIAKTTDGITERTDYDLRVHEARIPSFKRTNLNNSEITVDLNADVVKPVILQCFADGMPKPNITWFKNDMVLIGNEQYFFFHDRQELRIRYLLERDSGKYMCRIENRVGRRQVYQQITVKGKALPIGLIILIGILVLLVIILIIYFTTKVRREKIMRKELMEAGLMHFEEGALECLNPDLTVDDQAELLPYDRKWEFPRERLKLGKKLGSGAFGVVMKAEAQGICEDEAVTTVAVKMVRRTTDPTYVRALASELKIMVHLGKHLNVVNLLGACTKNISKRELLVIVEYCRFGNLHNYLLRHRSDFINQIDPATGKFDPNIGMDLLIRTNSVESNNRIKYAALSFSRSLSANSGTDTVHYCPAMATTDSQGVSMSPDGCVLSNNSSQPGWRSNYRGDYKDYNLKPICTQDLLSWAFQVARGMEYLSQRRVLHGDLAARNILLAENNVVKICDFGLAKTMYKDDNYKKKGDGPLPIKWMAIESIRDRVFSTQSDIWSFGIVLWEFFTLAETPYPGMEAEKQYSKLIEGYRMEKPEYATTEVYDIMLRCWKAKPTLRPSFTELVDSIGDSLEESVRSHYVSLNAPYIDMNTAVLEGGKNDYLTMMSPPDHAALSSPSHDYVNSPSINPTDPSYMCMSPTDRLNESGIFSPRPVPEKTHFEFPSPTSDSEDAVELSPMLKKQEEDDDPYLKPINVHERRAEFARQRQALKGRTGNMTSERDSGYCNTPRNLQLIDLNGRNDDDAEEPEEPGTDDLDSDQKCKDFGSSIIRTQDNYVNMPKQKIDLRKDVPDGFSNPSYVIMGNREVDQTRI